MADADLVPTANVDLGAPATRFAFPVHTVAEIAGVSVQPLQRRLGRRESRVSQLLDEARYRAAIRLLQSPTVRLTDTAYALGHSDVAHIARAVKRMAGVSPGEYRRSRSSWRGDARL